MGSVTIELAQPQWLWLLPVVLLLAWLSPGRPGSRVAGATRYLLPTMPILNAAGARLATRLKGRRHGGWRWLALALLVAALARPEQITEHTPEPPRQGDILFIVDTSVGMILRDYVVDGERVKRITVLKGVLDRFAGQLRHTRIGVIAYGDRAHTLVPVTADHTLVQRMLRRLRTDVAGRSNAMGSALALAVKQMQDKPGQRGVLILFTGGARPTGAIGPMEGVALARSAGLRLYTVAVGAGTEQSAEQGPSGLIYDTARHARLKSMAERTGGRMYWAGDTRALQQAIAEITQRERDPVEDEPRALRRPLYQWPLLAALLVLVWGEWMTLRRTAS